MSRTNRFASLLVLVLAGAYTTPLLANPITFGDLTFAAGSSYWNGSDLTGGFQSGGATFVNQYNPAWSAWNGFAYSKTTDTTTAGFGNQYSAYAGSGLGDATYGVAFTYDGAPAQLTLPTGASLLGAYFTNTTYAALSMLHGDSFARKFGTDDWFMLTIAGQDANGAGVGSVDVYLADFRNGLTYIAKDWAFANLSSLAGASSLYFSLSSSDNSLYGMNTPSYFAIDNITFADAIDPVHAPEPASLVLWGMLTAGAATAYRRRLRRGATEA